MGWRTDALKILQNPPKRDPKGGQNGAKIVKKLIKRGSQKKSKNEGPTNRLKAEKRPASHPRHHHFWTTGRDKGRGKPLPLRKRNVGNVGKMEECWKGTKSNL